MTADERGSLRGSTGEAVTVHPSSSEQVCLTRLSAVIHRYLTGNALRDLPVNAFSREAGVRFLWLDKNSLPHVPTPALNALTQLEAL